MHDLYSSWMYDLFFGRDCSFYSWKTSNLTWFGYKGPKSTVLSSSLFQSVSPLPCSVYIHSFGGQDRNTTHTQFLVYLILQITRHAIFWVGQWDSHISLVIRIIWFGMWSFHMGLILLNIYALSIWSWSHSISNYLRTTAMIIYSSVPIVNDNSHY